MAPWCAIAPIIDYYDQAGQLAAPVDLGGGVSFVEMPNWARSDAALKLLSWAKRTRLQRDCQFAFLTQYEAAALGTPDPDWEGPEPRSIQDRVAEKLALANTAVWLARPTQIPVEVVLHFDRPGDGTSMRQSSSYEGLLAHDRDRGNQLSMQNLSFAKQLNEGFLALTRDGTIWTATRLVWKALQERMWEVRFLLHWIAMEALFGSTDPQETTFRLSQRAAFFLAGSRGKAREIFDIAKRGYAWRSKTVHGVRLSGLTPAMSLELSYQVQEMLTNTLRRVLTDSRLASRFDSAEREAFLDGLIFVEGDLDDARSRGYGRA